jgi:Flp pilus assembly pilin Flp
MLTDEGEPTVHKIKKFLCDESGMEVLEYALVAAVVAAVALLIYGGGWGGVVLNSLKTATKVN